MELKTETLELFSTDSHNVLPRISGQSSFESKKQGLDC